ncbi:MAG: hypothetical protein WC700_02640 [Gemmatimonadaceae bacterium]|jgi:hypothetical protein
MAVQGLFSTPGGWLLAIAALVVLALIIKVAGAMVRIVVILVAIAGILWVVSQMAGR